MPLNVQLKLGSDYPVLSAYMQSRAPISTIRGPRGSGKTFGSAQRALMHMVEQEPNAQGVRHTRGMITRDSYSELMSTTVKDFLAVFKDLGDFRQGHPGPPSWVTKPGLYLDDGSLLAAEVIFQSSGVDDAEERVKGFQLSWGWFNEISGTRRGFFGNARAALGRYPSPADGGVPCSWYGILSDTNSFDEDHWLFPHATNPVEGWPWFHQPGAVRDSGKVDHLGRKIWLTRPDAENLSWLPGGEDWYRQLLISETDARIKVLLANEYDFFVDGKPVHPQYVDSVHCAPAPFEPDPAWPILSGYDFGRTPAGAFVQYDERYGRWLVFDEFCSIDMSAASFGPECKGYLSRRYPGFPVRGWGDPSGNDAGQATDDTPIRLLRAAGLPVDPAPSNREALRRAALVNPMQRLAMDGRPRFLLSPRCKMIRKGLMGGFCHRRLKIAGHERYTEEPDKNQYSHPVEALEYALLGGGEGREALRPATRRDYGGPLRFAVME